MFSGLSHVLGLRGAWRTRGLESLPMARAREPLSLYGYLRCPKSRKATREAGRKGVGSTNCGMNWRDLRMCAGELVRSPKEVFREHHRHSKGLHRCYTETDRFHHPRCGLSFISSNPGPFKTDMPFVVMCEQSFPRLSSEQSKYFGGFVSSSVHLRGGRH